MNQQLVPVPVREAQPVVRPQGGPPVYVEQASAYYVPAPYQPQQQAPMQVIVHAAPPRRTRRIPRVPMPLVFFASTWIPVMFGVDAVTLIAMGFVTWILAILNMHEVEE